MPCQKCHRSGHNARTCQLGGNDDYTVLIPQALAANNINEVVRLIQTELDNAENNADGDQADLANAVRYALNTSLQKQKRVVTELMAIGNQDIDEQVSSEIEQIGGPIDAWFSEQYLY